MKAYPECGPCMLKRALMFAKDQDEKTQYEVLRGVCRIFSEKFHQGATTTEIAYERNRFVEKVTQEKDPMKDLKEESFEIANRVYPKLEAYAKGLTDEKERFFTAMKIALAGNTLEFGAGEHEPDLDKLEDEIFTVIEQEPAIDDSKQVYEMSKDAENILYVTDNAPEVVMDKIFINELSSYAKVKIAPLSRPVQDDATELEIKKAGLDEEYEIIPRGDSIGVWYERSPPEFKEAFKKADLVIAKGMGCYETLIDVPEITKGKVALLFKVKCSAVAQDVGAPLGSVVITLI